MPRRLHQSNRIVEFAKRENPVSQRPDSPLGERRGDLAQQVTGQVRPARRQLVDIDREIGDVLAERPQVNSPIEVKIPFSEFEEAAKWSENLQAALHCLAAQRVEHDIDALPPGDLAHLIAKPQIARVENMIGAGQAQERSLHLRSGCGDHNRAAKLGILDRGKPHAAGGGMNQDMLPGCELRQMPQRVFHCDEGYGNGCGRRKTHSRRD
jgi:hypothetical protein